MKFYSSRNDSSPTVTLRLISARYLIRASDRNCLANSPSSERFEEQKRRFKWTVAARGRRERRNAAREEGKTSIAIQTMRPLENARRDRSIAKRFSFSRKKRSVIRDGAETRIVGRGLAREKFRETKRGENGGKVRYNGIRYNGIIPSMIFISETALQRRARRRRILVTDS